MPLSITTAALPPGSVNKTYSAQLQASGGVQPYTWSFTYGGELPDGLELDAATGNITGTPTNANGWAFTAQVTDADGATATANLNILISLILQIADLNLLAQNLTSQAIGVALSTNAIRLDWPTAGQPTFGVGDDVCFLRCVEEDDNYNRVRDNYRNRLDQQSLSVRTAFTRVWRISWTLYGPNSFDRARQIRSSLYTSAQRAFLAGLNLYPVADFPAPQRAPEQFTGGQWVERVDFSAAFNELVIEVAAVQTVGEVEVLIDNAAGQQKDFVARPGFAEGGFGQEGFGVEDYSS